MKIKIYKKSPSNKTNQNYQFDTDLVLEEPVLEGYMQVGPEDRLKQLKELAKKKSKEIDSISDKTRKSLAKKQQEDINQYISDYEKFLKTSKIVPNVGFINRARSVVDPYAFSQEDFEGVSNKMLTDIGRAQNALDQITNPKTNLEDFRRDTPRGMSETPRRVDNLLKKFTRNMAGVADNFEYFLSGDPTTVPGVTYFSNDASRPETATPTSTGQPVKETSTTTPNTGTTSGSTSTTGKGGPSKDKSVKVSKNEPLDWNADELIKRIQRPGFTDIDKWKKDVNNSSMPLENKLQLLELANDPVKDSKFALERLPGTEAIERNIPTEINTNLPTAFEKYNKQIQKSGIPRGNNTGNVLKGVGKALSTVNSGNGLFSRLLENARFARAFNDTAPIFRGKANYEYTAQPLIDFQPVADGIRGIFSDMTRNINTNSTTGGSVLSHLQGQATEQMVKAANDVAMKNQQIEAQNRNNALNAASRQFSEQQRLDASAYDQLLQNSAMRDTGINTAINGMIRTQADERERRQMFDTLPLLVPELEEVSTPFDRIMGRRKYGQSRDLQFSYANNRTTQA